MIWWVSRMERVARAACPPVSKPAAHTGVFVAPDPASGAPRLAHERLEGSEHGERVGRGIGGGQAMAVRAIGLEFPRAAAGGGRTLVGLLRLRYIQSGLPMNQSPASGSGRPAPKWKMRECSRKRPSTLMTRMFSLRPGTPGRRQQKPRTSRVMSTPAWLAA